MICINCNKDLRHCTCPDLGERLARLEKSPHLIIGGDYKQEIREQAERNKRKADDQQSLQA